LAERSTFPDPTLFFEGNEMMMTREIMEMMIGERFGDEPVSDETLREIETLRAVGRKLLDGIQAQNEIRFPWLKEVYNEVKPMAFILTIRERGNSWAGRSPFTSEHRSEADARAALVAYVKENWEAELEDEPPADEDEMVRQYFDEILEAYEIVKVSPEDFTQRL
jgi:hypothetical protein